MSERRYPTRLAGEFYKPLERRKLTTIIEQIRGDAFGDAYAVAAPAQAAHEMLLLTIERLELEIREEHGVGVLESLHQEVLPIYKENTAGSATLIFMFDEALQEHKGDSSSKYCKAFIDWMLRWNIAERWIRDAAVTTLSRWSDEWQE